MQPFGSCRYPLAAYCNLQRLQDETLRYISSCKQYWLHGALCLFTVLPGLELREIEPFGSCRYPLTEYCNLQRLQDETLRYISSCKQYWELRLCACSLYYQAERAWGKWSLLDLADTHWLNTAICSDYKMRQCDTFQAVSSTGSWGSVPVHCITRLRAEGNGAFWILQIPTGCILQSAAVTRRDTALHFKL
jgi:hypothetical protein